MVKRFFRILIYAIKLDKWYLPIRLLLAFLAFISYAIGLMLPKFILNAIAKNNLNLIFVILLIFSSFSIINSAIEKIMNPKLALRQERVKAKILDDFLHKSIRLKLEYFDHEKAYDRYTLAFDQCCAVIQNTCNILLTLFSSILQILFIIYILSWIPPLIIAFFMIVCFAQVYLSNMVRKYNYALQKQMSHHNRKLNYIYRLFFMPEFIRDIRVNEIEDFVFAKKNELNKAVFCDTHEITSKVAAKTFITSILSIIESFATMLYFSIQVVRQIIWYDDFIVSYNAYNRLKISFSQILTSLVDFSANDLFIKDYLAFMDTPSEIQCGSRQISQIDSVEFQGVSFKYPNCTEYALVNISFCIKKGEHVAIIGENGAGKTTIIKLLLRLYDPCMGSILVNGVNIAEYNISALRRIVSVLFQDYSVYAFSIRENLTLGASISDKEIMEALTRVNLLGKVMKLPMKLDTPITNQLSEGGVEFSGGEKQRLALARTYLRKQPLFVFDEPTSNLDPFVESAFYEDLLAKTSNTVIVISHRVTFMYQMTRIICMKNGSIAEIGAPSQLLKNPQSIYKELCDLNDANGKTQK